MPLYVLNRNYTLMGFGHAINFIKGQPVNIPPSLVLDAQKIGAEPVEGEREEMLPDEPVVPVVPEGEARAAALTAVFKSIDARKQREDFTAQGVPSAKAVSDLAGFHVTKEEVVDGYHAYRASLEGAA
ncbi:MAG: hypothetical protein LBV29_02930 [Azoarcus sp.]|jgi:hypothetical protein|nr:hypothetical protein [Azoarcus sp.]